MKKIIVLLLTILTGWNTAYGQQLVGENVFKDITLLEEVRDTRFLRPSPAGKLRKAGKPVAFYIGDSTMRTLSAGNGWSGEWGFGLFAQEWFDENELVVENHALGGTSSRTFYNDEWPTVRDGIMEGDYVVISFGHNDGGSNWTTKSSIGGTSATDTKVVTNSKGVTETVYSYGQYLRMFVDEIKALGATPILCSRTPRGSFTDGVPTMDNNYRQWSKAIAEEKGVAFIDIEGVANPLYQKYGEWKVTQLYFKGTLHTSLMGAWHNAYCAVMSIDADDTNPLKQYLKDITPPKMSIERQAGKPYTFNLGGDDTSARDIFRSGQWSLIYNTLEEGDSVVFTFGNNELRSITDDGEMGCIQSAEDSRTETQMSSTGRWEVVCSYGWYIHYFLNDIKEKGAVGVLVNNEETMPADVIAWNESLAETYGAILRTPGKEQPAPSGLKTPVSQMEKLTRGVVALPAENGGIFVSWRMLGTDPLTTLFDLLRDGEVIAENLYNRTNFIDEQGTSESQYQVVTKVNGIEKERTDAVSSWDDKYKVLQLNRPADGIDDVTGNTYRYTPNDCAVGDVDGDGEYEIILQWQPSNKTDNKGQENHPGREFIDCYKMNGEQLWRIDMGLNILAGDHHTQMLVYDFDRDGKAELIMRTAPGTKDGEGNYVNQASDDDEIRGADNSIDWRSPTKEIIIGGQEYLTIFEGASGRAIHTIFYNPNRDGGYGGEATGLELNWDSRAGRKDYAGTYGNRANRFLATVAFLDGQEKAPSAIICRGYYSYSFLWAVDFDGSKLTHRWLHSSLSKTEVRLTNSQFEDEYRYYDSNTFGTSDTYTAFAQGNHQVAVADVDNDGCDEIIYGAATIDNDGWLLYSTGLGHGDAMHVCDIMPDRPGLEVLRCNETSPFGLEIHDAATGENLYHVEASKDTGRALAADITSEYRGLEFWGGQRNLPRETASGNFEIATDSIMPSMNFRIYWDGDLLDELFDGSFDTNTEIAHPNIMKWNGKNFDTIRVEYNGSQTCNWTKATPCIQADLFGDWREELIMWNYDDPSQLNIITTNIPSEHRVPTLMHDHLYRMGIAWQNVTYNQPPHLGYYLPDEDFSYPTLKYAVMEMADGTCVRKTEGEKITESEMVVPYRLYNVLDGRLYMRTASGGPKYREFNHYFTLNQRTQEEPLEYEPTDIYNVVYLSEAEDIAGMTLCTSTNTSVRSSNSSSAYAATDKVLATTLQPGIYRLTAVIYDSSKNPDSNWSFYAGDKEVANLHCNVVNIQELTSEEFTITKTTDFYIGAGGSDRRGIDLLYIVKEGDVPVTRGDANGDGKVSIADVTTIASYLLGETPEGFNADGADANEDGRVSIADVTTIVSMLLGEE